jgi:O-antigen/teichoic acid export membrane protein
VVAIYAGSTLLTAVVAIGLNRARLWISAGGLALNIAANFWAVPRFGIAGAGATTFATELFVAVSAAWVLARHGVALGSAWRWLGGVALFALAAWISSLLPLG